MPPSRPALYSPRLDDALAFVAGAFRHRARKGSDVPYLTHLLQVMVLVAEHGGNEDQMVAALLHDYLEDIEGASRSLVAERFGDRVARLVDHLTESSSHPRPPWRERKTSYIERLRTAAPDVKLVSVADKLHNAMSLRADLERDGPATWQRFTGTREETLWFYRTVTDALSENFHHPLVDRLRVEVAVLVGHDPQDA